MAQIRVRRDSIEGAAWLKLGCGVAQLRVRKAQNRVRRSSNNSAPACCKAGPSSNRILARHPRGGPLLSESDADNRKRFSTSYIYKYCMYAR
jgi:hypothetical protein